MRNNTLAVLSVFALGAAATPFTQGAVVYSYAAGAAHYTGVAGGTVMVNLYLDETLTGVSTSYIATHGGLTTAGAAVNGTGTTGGTAASFGSGSFSNAAAFTGGSSDTYYDQNAGNNLEFTETVPAGTSTGAMPTSSQVLLGTLDVTIGSGTTTYSVTSLNNDLINGELGGTGSLGNTNTPLPSPVGSDLDAPSASYTGADLSPAFTFTVGPLTAVPEPASLSLLGVGAMGLFRRRR